MNAAVPILMYHQVTNVPTPVLSRYTVTNRRFDAHMRLLQVLGYTSISPSHLWDVCVRGNPLPVRPVMITFDDGLTDCVRYAPPILECYGFFGIFYIVAGLAGKRSEWLVAEQGAALPMASWAELRDLFGRGHVCGAHTMNHPRLDLLSREECLYELVESRRILQEQLGRTVDHIAYPYGRHNAGVVQCASAAGYRTACSTRPGHARASDGLLSLARHSIYCHTHLADVACLLLVGSTLRQLLQRARQPQPRMLQESL